MRTSLSTRDAAAAVTGLDVLTVPTVSQVITTPGGSDSTAAIIGGVVGGLFGGGLLIGGAYVFLKRKQSKVEA